MYEHLEIKNGQIKGLYMIDPTKVNKKEFWQNIDDIVGDYAKIHPDEMTMLVYENKAIADQRLKNTGASKSGSIRWGASIPAALMFKLEAFEPMLFTDKSLFHKFLKKYKGFRTCKVV